MLEENLSELIIKTAAIRSLRLNMCGASPLLLPQGLSLEQSLNLLFQFGQIIPDSRPDDFQIDKEVLMDRYVAHAAHLRPGNFRVLFDEGRRRAVNLVHGFANNFDLADNSVLNLRIVLKGFDVW
jgi:hypothetical protein